jgi:serine/threonine-protein kinase
MSPEQARGRRATNASDVYSMGIILYEVATGAVPFHSDNQLGFLYQHVDIEPPRPTMRAPYPSELGELALACLRKDADDRPTMTRVADHLDAMTLRRPRFLRLALLLVLLALAIGAYLLVRA